MKSIIVRGAKEHNLKNIDLEIPRDKLVVITGLSGSGKSSLAFDTIYAEGQRRYVESLSAYARQFLEQMDKPDVESIEGLSPAISIEQRTLSKNPRSTVGTVTEIYDYLRVLFARIGKPYCHKCGKEISSQTIQQIVDQLKELPQGSKIILFAPLVQGRKGEYRKELNQLRKSGFARVKIDGHVKDLSEDIPLNKNKKHQDNQGKLIYPISPTLQLVIRLNTTDQILMGQLTLSINFKSLCQILQKHHMKMIMEQNTGFHRLFWLMDQRMMMVFKTENISLVENVSKIEMVECQK